ncbi:MAG TPA: methyltransferase domain-containing protein [Candidatus Nanoarchaeia archaeon]|nr:methyltransferase domain-containing protein [Candidatus Nanoarchaeia archaeon]
MKYLFFLHGDYQKIANEEVLSLFGPEKHLSVERAVIIDSESEEKIISLGSRLALTKSIFRILLECEESKLKDKIEQLDWNLIYKKSFCVRNYNLDKSKKLNFSENEIAEMIWDKLNNPKVDLEKPKTHIGFFFFGKKVYCGLLIKEIKGDFDSRKAHKRPFNHPGSLHPKAARALINISEIKGNEKILDPFCGTGGFLIEASLMGISSKGYDIDKSLIEGCRENLKFFNIINSRVESRNALKLAEKADYVVSDLPYGLNSNACFEENEWKKHRVNKKVQSKKIFTENIERFYFMFLKRLKKCLKKKAVLIFPHYVNYKSLLKKSGFKLEKEFEIYVHGSLTRKIVKIK